MLYRVFKQLQKTKMTKEEHDHLLAYLKEKIDADVRIDSVNRHIVQRVSPLPLFFNHKRMFANVMLSILLAATGGASVAAESSLPGDLLYPVKLQLNERVRGAVTMGDKHNADWETRRVERRVEEIISLSGKTDAEVQEKITLRLEQQIGRAEDHVEKLKAEGNLEAAAAVEARLQGMLDAHEQLLSGEVDVEKIKGLPKVLQMLEKKQEIGDDNKGQRLKETDPAKMESAARGISNAATNKIAEVQTYVNEKSDSIDAAALARAKVQLAEAVALKAKADQSVTAGAFVDAFTQYKESLRLAQSAKMMIHGRLLMDDQGERRGPKSNDVRLEDREAIEQRREEHREERGNDRSEDRRGRGNTNRIEDDSRDSIDDSDNRETEDDRDDDNDESLLNIQL